MSTYSEVYLFEELPLVGEAAGFVSGKALVAIDRVTTDYYIEKLFLDDAVVVPSDELLYDVCVQSESGGVIESSLGMMIETAPLLASGFDTCRG